MCKTTRNRSVLHIPADNSRARREVNKLSSLFEKWTHQSESATPSPDISDTINPRKRASNAGQVCSRAVSLLGVSWPSWKYNELTHCSLLPTFSFWFLTPMIQTQNQRHISQSPQTLLYKLILKSSIVSCWWSTFYIITFLAKNTNYHNLRGNWLLLFFYLFKHVFVLFCLLGRYLYCTVHTDMFIW